MIFFLIKYSTFPDIACGVKKKGELNTKKVQLTNADTDNAKSLSPSVLCVYIATLGMSG